MNLQMGLFIGRYQRTWVVTWLCVYFYCYCHNTVSGIQVLFMTRKSQVLERYSFFWPPIISASLSFKCCYSLCHHMGSAITVIFTSFLKCDWMYKTVLYAYEKYGSFQWTYEVFARKMFVGNMCFKRPTGEPVGWMLHRFL